MRNLILESISVLGVENNWIAVVIDVEEDVVYAASETKTADADVSVEIWKLRVDGDEGGGLGGEAMTSFTSVGSSTDGQVTSASEVVSLRFLAENRCVVVIMRGGDIVTIPLENDVPEAEVVGSVEAGIYGAAWSPDDTLLVLASGDDKIILMTSTFDVLTETPIYTSEFGEDAPINVGWGSKQTQFHGSLGKSAAQAPTPNLSSVGASPDDDAVPRISWRGDGAFFVLSTLSPQPKNPEEKRRRMLRVYDREGVLKSTSEPVAGLEGALSWRPSGNLIASTQRFGGAGLGAGREGRHDLVFFERNGLRHGEFGLREGARMAEKGKGVEGAWKWGYRIKEVGWSSDSNVLAIWIERETVDVIQLWTTGNYHWYLKQEITPPSSSGQQGRFTSMAWHPEALKIVFTCPEGVIQRSYAWETCASRTKPPGDTGSVGVVDGTAILLTPFRIQNVPPPMSSCKLELDQGAPRSQRGVPIHMAFCRKRDILAILWEDGWVQVWDLRTRLSFGRGKVMDPEKLWEGEVSRSGIFCRQILVWSTDSHNHDSGLIARVAILGKDGKKGRDLLTTAILTRSRPAQREEAILNDVGANARLLNSESNIWIQGRDGGIFAVNENGSVLSSVTRFPEFCLDAERVLVSPADAFSEFAVGLSQSGRLHVTARFSSSSFDHPPSRLTLASNANSFAIASGFVIYTTTAHEAHFTSITKLIEALYSGDDDMHEKVKGEKRRVERGSRIVTVVPSAMNLVLQMPRGNLETISPRPLVMEVVHQDIDAGNYRKAFVACRKHRIDMNVIVDRNRDQFMQRLGDFIEQVDDVEDINLFLTNVGRGNQPSEVIAGVCDAIREMLEQRNLIRYVNSILTAHVVKTPPDHEAALGLLLRLRDSDSALVEDAVKYIIFLVDVDRLLDTALGMYDFSLFLMIAQHAQKDPREYLPFLRELRSFGKWYQRFRIDVHLKRHEKALKNLYEAGTEYFDEAMAYVEKHRLYELALTLWKGTERYEDVLDIYGEWLFDRRDFKQAALVYLTAGKRHKAMVAYEKSLQWQELFELAVLEKTPEDDMVAMAYRVADDLSAKKRYADAGRVLLDYSKNLRQAIISYAEGNAFSEARRIITLHAAPELLADIIHPTTLETCAQLGEDIAEMREQLRKQVGRLRELRVKKTQEPEAFYGMEDTDLHNVDVMTDISMAPTTFTRYTVAPSTASRTSKRSSRSKRKMERKVGSGRKGTVDEEEYLLKSVTKLVGRFTNTQGEVSNILPHLFQFTDEHKEEGLALQQDLAEFEGELKNAIEEIWADPAEDEGQPPTSDGWAARMAKVEQDRMINPLDKVPKPGVVSGDWRLPLLAL